VVCDELSGGPAYHSLVLLAEGFYAECSSRYTFPSVDAGILDPSGSTFRPTVNKATLNSVQGGLVAHCSDPRLTYLNNLGYNVLKLPREGVDPLEILGRDGSSMEDLGPLSTIWTSNVAVPTTGTTQAVDVNGQKTSDLKLSIGLDILASVLQGMGVPAPSLNTAYSKASSVQFTFTNVQVVRVAPLEVGKYLAHGDLDTSNAFATYFQDHDKEAYVITEVLKSNAIKVTAKNDSGVSVGVDLPNIQNVLGTKVNVAASGSGNQELTYQGQTMVTFGFKVFGISFADGNWQIHGQAPGKDIAYMMPHDPKPVMISQGKLLSSFPRRSLKLAA
jgi:hypothetical protein